MKTTKIKSWLPVFLGFYGTCFEPDEDRAILEDENKGYTFDDYDFDYDTYYQDVAKECVNQIQRKLKKLNLSCKIKFEELKSPREYNFYNDSINVTYQVSETFVKKLKSYCTDNIGDFDEYLTRYKSCSGFISHYSYLFTDWLEYIEVNYLENNAHILGAVLDFVLNNEDFTEYVLSDLVSEQCYLYGEVKESSKPQDFELNGIHFAGHLEDIESDFEYRNFYTDLNFFEWCLANLKQIIYNDPNQLTLF